MSLDGGFMHRGRTAITSPFNAAKQVALRVASIASILLDAFRTVTLRDMMSLSREDCSQLAKVLGYVAVVVPGSILVGAVVARGLFGPDDVTYGCYAGPIVLTCVIWGKVFYDWNQIAKDVESAAV